MTEVVDLILAVVPVIVMIGVIGMLMKSINKF
jgi:hypothetical protein